MRWGLVIGRRQKSLIRTGILRAEPTEEVQGPQLGTQGALGQGAREASKDHSRNSMSSTLTMENDVVFLKHIKLSKLLDEVIQL